MSAFGHAGFGSANRRNQLRAQGQIGADTYGQSVRNAMQAPTMNIYSAPQTYQQATGQQAQQPTAAPQTNQPSTSVSQPAPPVYKTDNEQPDMQTYTPPPSPGTAQPIQPPSTGTPYGDPPPADTEENNNPARQPTFESNVYTGPPGLRNQPRRFQDMNRQRNSTDFIGQSFGEGVGQAMGLGSAGQTPRPGTGRDDVVMAFGRPVGVESDLAYQHYTSMLQMAQRNGLAPEQLLSSEELAKAQRSLQWGQQKKAEEQERSARFNEIQDLRRQLVGGTSAQDDEILYRLNTLEGGQQTSWEDFSRMRQVERDNAPLAAQKKDRQKFIDEWLQEQRRAAMSPAEYQQSRQRSREFSKPQGTVQNDPYIFAGQHRGNPASLDAEMARRFYERQAAQRNDAASQEQFLAEWQGPRSFEEWYAQRYGEDAKQKWNLL